MLHQVGAGTLGPVFRGFDSEHDRLVAIKLFNLDLPPDRAHRLAAELDRLVAAQLTHPAIAAPLAAGVSGTHAYLVSEFAAADSLDIVVRDYGPAPVSEAIRVAAQLAGALDFAAVVNIDHGALHPRDVLISRDDTRLTGLGVARALERVGIAVPVRRPYAAPERLSAEPARVAEPGLEMLRRADVFSLAAVIAELVTAKRVTGTGATAAGTIPDVPGASASALREVFARALAEDPAARFDTALAFAEALKNACPGVTVSAPDPHAPRRRGSVAVAEPPEPRLPLDDAPRDVAAEIMAMPLPSAPAPADFDLHVPEPPAAAAVLDTTPAVAAPVAPVAAAAEEPAPIRVEPRARVRPADSSPSSGSPRAASRSDVGRSAVSRRSAVPAPQRSRSGFGTIALAMLVGIALGFAGGYSVALRQQPLGAGVGPVVATTGAPAEPAPATPAAGTPVAAGATPPAAAATRPSAAAPVQPRPAAPPATPPASAAAARSSAVPRADEGRLLVRSMPAGARVIVDGRERGRTPMAISDVAPGAHRVRLERDGYAAVERRVVLTRTNPVEAVTVELARERAAAAPASNDRFVGELAVASLPSGARVFVDNRLVGTTPIVLSQLRAGEHAVRIERSGYRRWSSSVRVQAGQRNRVTASLEK